MTEATPSPRPPAVPAGDRPGDRSSLSRSHWSTVAANYATSASHAGGEDLAWFRAAAASVVPGVALDVACGGGFSTRALLEAGHRVVATDLTPESVAAARGATDAAAPALWAAGAAERLPVRTASVDLAACRIAPHHFADPAAFVDEVVRVLKPAGMFLLVDTAAPEDEALARWLDDVERLRDPTHGASWPPSRWTAVLRGAGLDVAELRTFRKRHELEPWLARSGCTGETAEEVRRRFREAAPGVVAELRVEVDGGTVVAYTDTKVCLRAVRPAPRQG